MKNTTTIDGTLKDKVHLVTGGTSGVGQAIATGLAAKGAKVVIVSRTAASGQQGVRHIARVTGNDQAEFLERPVFADLADAQASVADYFDCYNHERLHSSIDCQTPYHTHQQLLRISALNCPA
ncbi:MAG: SDR family NAD(P)-dependent oxidoreductase [Hymenobacter sp.]|nr:MAG: SDR family NAD(P)-dependent oxidoreductase [Hymenobacter sp.]